jgi:hypothetical protein
MSISSGDDGFVLECAARDPGLAAEFRVGWERWLEGARLAQLTSDRDDAVHVSVLRAGRNGFLVVAEEGIFPCMGPWHCNGWVDNYWWYYYFGCLVYMDPFDKWFFDSSGFFSAHLGERGRIVYNDQAGGHCCWLDASDWWSFCRTFLLLEVPIEQSTAGFIGWVTRVVADLLDWVVGVWSSAGDGADSGLLPQVMEFASVLMRFLLVCGGSGVFPHYLADKHWPC